MLPSVTTTTRVEADLSQSTPIAIATYRTLQHYSDIDLTVHHHNDAQATEVFLTAHFLHFLRDIGLCMHETKYHYLRSNAGGITAAHSKYD